MGLGWDGEVGTTINLCSGKVQALSWGGVVSHKDGRCTQAAVPGSETHSQHPSQL